MDASPILSIEQLSLDIGHKPILRDIDLAVHAGSVHAIVGESGSGKSMTALATMQLLPNGAKPSGTITFQDRNLLELTKPEMCALRGDDIGMVFQEPMTALNPVMTIGEQVAEGIRWHEGASQPVHRLS